MYQRATCCWREHTIVSVPRMAGPYTIPRAVRQHSKHTLGTMSWATGGMRAGSEEAGKERWRMEGRMDGGRTGREGGRKR